MSCPCDPHFFVVDGEWVLLVIIDDYSCSCGFYAYVICALTSFVGLVARACLVGCLSSIDETLCSLLQGELVIHLSFRGSMLFCIEKPRGLVTTLLSWEIGVCHTYGLVCGRVSDFVLYIVYFPFLLYFLHTHLSHFVSHVILACICLIMLITMLG
jgi:hypothetical protein